MLKRLIDQENTRHPFYGTRRMVVYLRVMRPHRQPQTGAAADACARSGGRGTGANTIWVHPQHKMYPHLLRGIAVVRPDQFWSTDITYIRFEPGFVYLAAVIGWYSRRVLSWRISKSMEAVFCVDCPEGALRAHGRPEIFNTDQGPKFISQSFTGALKREGVAISMDGQGRVFDNIFVERLWRNVKHEDVYRNGRHDEQDADRLDEILYLLQRRAPASRAGQPDSRRGVQEC